MKKFYQRLRYALGFSQRETNGFLLLSAIMVLAVVVLFWIPALFPAPDYNPITDQQQLDSLVALLDTSTSQPVRYASQKSSEKYSPPATQTLFPFNPNTISAVQWQQLGLPAWLAQRILRYRNKGGSFRIKSDLQRIYDFPEPLYAQLHPYIQLPEQLPDALQNSISEKAKTLPFSQPKREPALVRFDLNTADTTQLKAIRGIGSGLSRRIVKYRDALGGFSRPDQVREVYGLDSLVVNELLRYAFIADSQPIKRLRVNTATVEELDAHPYITPRLAKVIVAYRTQHGVYRSADDLSQIKIMDQTTLQKITPYLSFE